MSATPSAQLDMTARVTDSATIVALDGELDLTSADGLRAFLDPIVSFATTDLIIDMDHLTFMDSVGVSVLVRAHRIVREAGHTLVAVNPPPIVLTVLRTTGVDVLLHVTDDDA